MEACAYTDHALSIGYKATISQPSTVAFMLERLRAKRGDKVLDLGAGLGWATALLSNNVGEHGFVYGVERVHTLVAFGKAKLNKYQLPNVTLLQVNQVLGLPA